MSRARVLLMALLVASLTAACNNGPLPTTADTRTTTTTTTTTVSPVTETFSSQLAVGGYAFRSITAVKAGAITVTLTSLSSVGSTTTLKVGMGLGIPDSTGTGCLFTRTTETAAGGALTANVDAGAYCVRLWDLGTLKATTPFTVTIIRP